MTQKPTDYITATEACAVMGITRNRLQVLLRDGLIEGAHRVKLGKEVRWQIPRTSAEAPRRRAGRPRTKKEI